MARERESTRSRSRERDNDDRSNRSKKGGAGRKIAINLDPKSYEQYGLWGDGEEVLIQDAWAAPFNYGGKTYEDGKQRVTLALFFEYLDEATHDTHIEPVSYGDLRHHAPGNSPEEFDFAGGDETTWAKVVSGEEEITDDMRGPYVLPVPQGFNADGEPIYRRLKGSKATNGDWYIQSAIKCANAAGIDLKFNPDDPNLRDLFVGIRGRLARLPNTLRKGPGSESSDKNPPLVFEEIYEKIDASKSGRKRAAKEDDDDKPAERTRGRRGRETQEEDLELPLSNDPKNDPPRRRGGRKATEPTPEFLEDFKSKVEAFLDSQPKKSCKRTRMTDLVEEYDVDTPEERWALEVITEDKYIETFWAASDDVFDYDEETDTAKL